MRQRDGWQQLRIEVELTQIRCRRPIGLDELDHHRDALIAAVNLRSFDTAHLVTHRLRYRARIEAKSMEALAMTGRAVRLVWDRIHPLPVVADLTLPGGGTSPH